MDLRPLLLLALLVACSGPQTLVVELDADTADSLRGFVQHIGDERLTQEIQDAPDGRGSGVRVALVADGWSGCGDCYAIEGEGNSWTVRGGQLGLQYGLAHLLEAYGYRFFHPHDSLRPETLASPDPEGLVGEHGPEMTLRGLQMHTLHPIEGYYDFWEPGGENLDGAKRVIDWVIKNRGNHLQWVGLDDIEGSPGTRGLWRDHTAAILEEAHARGLSTSLGIQLYGAANLQQAYDLLDGGEDDVAAAIEERLRNVSEGTPFSGYNLSFGEFFEAEAQDFIDTVDLSWDVLQEVAPGAWYSTLVHVGADLVVDYQDEQYIYYLLAQFADSAITPHVHTVMYYNLFDDPGGSYHHQDYDDHRALLLDRLAADEPVAYFPESAYWIAFDNSIPTYLPIYVKSRWRDIEETRLVAEANGHEPLRLHVLFSSGWEWGYWQTDVAVLRSNWALPAAFGDAYAWMFEPYGDAGLELAAALTDLADRQYEDLITRRLGAYLSSKDSTMEIGYALDIISQPRRPSYNDIRGMGAGRMPGFRAEVVEALFAHAEATWAVHQRIVDAGLPDDPWVREVLDGVEIDALRAEYIAELMAAAADDAEGRDPAGWADRADALFSEARVVVDRRHGELHDPSGEQLFTPNDNATIYQYGYLIRADELCFWERERVRLANHLEGSDLAAPGCAL